MRKGCGWNDISTAPKDGTKLDLWFSGLKSPEGYRVPDAWWGSSINQHEPTWIADNGGDGSRNYAGHFDSDAATHWRLPPLGPDMTRVALTAAQIAMKDKIESLMTDKGGYSREALASLGVAWPPRQGWKAKLIQEAK